MNAKAISATPTPGQADPPLDGTAAGQVAMVVMLVPITPATAGAPQAHLEPAPPYLDSHDHIWLLVDKASPMAAVFEQITGAEASVLLETHPHLTSDHSPWHETGHPHSATFIETLSPREIDVLRLMADGQSNQEIAEVLVVALNTVKMHVKHIYRKLGVKNRVQAVAQARGLGLLETTMH